MPRATLNTASWCRRTNPGKAWSRSASASTTDENTGTAAAVARADRSPPVDGPARLEEILHRHAAVAEAVESVEERGQGLDGSRPVRYPTVVGQDDRSRPDPLQQRLHGAARVGRMVDEALEGELPEDRAGLRGVGG